MDNNMNGDFELYDFIADANFDQFVDLIRGENEDRTAGFPFADDVINGGSFSDNTNNNHNFPGPMINPHPNNFNNNNNNFGFGDAFDSPPPNYALFSGHDHAALPGFDGEIVMGGGGDDDDENEDEEDSSATTTNTTTNTTTKLRPKIDRSRTLISERRRRGRMKDKLYALRSLVPNITKMDKASIVGDAVLYLEDLQSQAKKLKAEIESLEASLEGAERYQLGSKDQSAKNKAKASKSTSSVLVKTITQMDMFQVEERGFYVKVVCNIGEGIAVSLYKALESLTSFNVQSSNLATPNSDTYVLTFILNVKECEQEQINLPNLKLWVKGAFLNQGFELN